MLRNSAIQSVSRIRVKRRTVADPMRVSNRSVLGIRQVPVGSEQRWSETDAEASQPRDKSNRLDWVAPALCLFLIFSFAALAFALYVIWNRCRGDSPL